MRLTNNEKPVQLHAIDCSAHDFWTKQVHVLNKLNPQVATRLVRTLYHWKKYNPALKKTDAGHIAEGGYNKRFVQRCAGAVGKGFGLADYAMKIYHRMQSVLIVTLSAGLCKDKCIKIDSHL
jgi:hypothetical protein